MSPAAAVTPHRFALLDGIRGVAAIFVVTRHVNIFPDIMYGRSYLAVDIFFLLSGFVIAHAYDQRLSSGRLSVWEFMKVRIIRLYPVFLLSVIFIIALRPPFLFPHGFDFNSLFVIVMTLFLLPSFVPDRGLFPFGNGYWSLFFEMLMNIIYAVIRPILTDRVLMAIVLSSGIALGIMVSFYGKMDMGYKWDISLLGGLLRSAFGIFLGVLMFRHRDRWPNLLGFSPNWLAPWLILFIVSAILILPTTYRFNGVIDAFIVLMVLPPVVLAASQVRPSRFDPVFILLGAASYPLYLLHISIFKTYALAINDPTPYFSLQKGLVFLVGMVLICAALERWVDAPVREWVKGTLRKRRQVRLAQEG